VKLHTALTGLIAIFALIACDDAPVGQADGATDLGGTADAQTDLGVQDADLQTPDAGTRCNADDLCAEGEICRETGFCGAPCTPQDCAGGYCAATGQCVDDACGDDGVCPADTFCDAEGACLPGCRRAPDDCPVGQICDDNHICIPEQACQPNEICGNNVDDDCNGIVDDPATCQAPCVPEQACFTGALGVCADGLTQCPDGPVGPPQCIPIAQANATERCDGVDDDCDGSTDEGYNLGQACPGGEGLCADNGVWICDAESGEAQCDANSRATPERCDGLDNNCDGQIDETWPLLGQPCHVGAGQCAAQGVFDCAATGDGLACDAAPGEAGEEICDGIDNNCNGRTDEEAPGVGERCTVGVGACAVEGWRVCFGDDSNRTRCDARPALPTAETCNGVDDDCDGEIDEGADGPLSEACYTGDPETEDRGECRRGLRTCAEGRWSACGGEVTPTAEICDGRDNDCNGVADDGPGNTPLRESCYDGPEATAGTGQCQAGERTCRFGRPGPCLGQVMPAPADICDGADNDCNGQTDEIPGGCACEAGEVRACYTGPENTVGTGACVDGRQTCLPDGSAWGACVGEHVPTIETCNGLDDNCNGEADEGVVSVGLDCAEGVGACANQGSVICDPEAGVRCDVSAHAPTAEACDGLDNDCDGRTDETFAVGLPCTRGTGACERPGTTRCGGRGELTCDAAPGFPIDEICNGLDDNCDGQIDEAFRIGERCSVGEGACQRQGLFQCANEAEAVCGAALVEASAETCNGADDDCDGTTDEGFVLGEACVIGVGLCRSEGQTICGADGGTTCDAPPQVGRLELCNGLDDDCDGEIDEGMAHGPRCDTGTPGACRQGHFSCIDGQQLCMGAQPSEEICNGIDDDCNGETDDGLPVVTCGQGECEREIPSCLDGAPFACDPEAGAADVELCNGIDDDCDGAIDEDAIGHNAPCEAGVGACQRVGHAACVGGELLCDAEPGAPTVELCDYTDNDCDGAVDEEAAGTGAPCGVGIGACRTPGAIACTDGQLVCPVQPGEPQGPEICDGIDNDCDGLLDEGFGSEICGVGACRRALANCGGGQAPECDPFEGAQPETCNGIDDDCDGVIDEEPQGTGEICRVGQGACERDGATACVAGQIQCDGTPGFPSFETCDLIDNNCDGRIDNDPVDVGRGCMNGTGACERAGVTQCAQGAITCDATPGLPRDEICNEADDDCDGTIDEGFGEVIECGVGVCYRQYAVCGDAPACDPLEGASPELCNGLDDDCDGQIDEDASDVGRPCSTGEGACFREGLTVCTDAREVCGVEAGAPVAELCNEIDDDCDGPVDEGDVCPDVSDPTVEIILSDDLVDVGTQITITLRATDDRGVTATSLRINGTPTALDGNHQARFRPAFAGFHSIEADARDAANNLGADTRRVRATDPNDVTPPTATITSPEADVEITEPVEIRGDAEDDNLYGYRLQYAPVGTQDWTTFVDSDQPPEGGLLGRFDPTVLVNGIYTLRLVVEDVNGRLGAAERVVRVDGQNKVGAFTITYTDLTVPVAGVPLTVERTYDSRVKQRRDFGVGWTLSLRQGKMQHGTPLNEGWRLEPGGFLGLPCHSTTPLAAHTTEVHLSDEERYVFSMDVIPGGIMLGGCQVQVQFNYVGGSIPGRATLQSLSGTLGTYINGTEELWTADFSEPFDMNRARLTTPDGRAFEVSLSDGVFRLLDGRGNQVDVRDDGLIHSSGHNVEFQRDAHGRIHRVLAPNGDAIVYEYDARGDLSSVTDPGGNTTRYTYDAQHNLLRITDPTGQTPARQEYDPETGRLVAIVYPDGVRVAMEHNVDERVEVVRDRLGAVEVFTYDSYGNVLRHTDKLGHTTISVFDALNHRTLKTDRTGADTRYDYDDQGRMTALHDAADQARSQRYNARNKPIEATDRNGNTTTHVYDDQGNLLRSTDPLGHSTAYTYSENGQRLTRTDALGQVWTNTYGEDGFKTTETDPLGQVTHFTYDANGLLTRKVKPWTNGDGEEVEAVWTYAYDANSNLVLETNPIGGRTVTTWDARGKRASDTDALGRRTEHRYDPLGNVLEERFSDGTVLRFGYDAESRRVTETDRSGRVTRTEYDLEDRPLVIHLPDGTTLARAYDAEGRILRETDGRAQEIAFEYNALGRLVRKEDALGQVSTYGYDANGNRTRVTGPDGQTTEFEYDANNRKISTVFPDGTTYTTEYDAIGQKIAETDQAGRATQYSYDALGHLTEVVDAAGGVSQYTYNSRGFRTGETDAAGHTTRYVHDALGRAIRKLRPAGELMTATYDLMGNKTGQVDYNGDELLFVWDANDKLAEIQYPDDTIDAASYSPTGKRLTVQDGRGVTRWRYDALDRVIERTEPDGARISYTYDGSGNRTAVTTRDGTTHYTYDALNRLARVTDAADQLSEYTYDAAGNRATLSLANGLTTHYQYDALRRLIGMSVLQGDAIIAQYAYGLGPAGNRLRVVELHTGRTVDYSYDALYRLTEERITDAEGDERIITYAYDAAGNRQRRNDSVDGETLYTYDANDQLATVDGIPYRYDANGNLLQVGEGDAVVNYSYDLRNRLVGAEYDDRAVGFEYNIDGARVARTVSVGEDTETVRYIIDDNREFSQALLEINSDGDISARYVFGHELISQTRGDATHYSVTDGQLSVRYLADADGAITDAYDYDAFGRVIARTGETENPYQYNGQFLEPNLGFYYLRARWLDPDLGRFTSMDPQEALLFEPQTLHRYTYVLNDPVNHQDPNGEFLIGISISLSISGNLRSIYSYNLVKLLLKVIRIAMCQLAPGYKLRWLGIDMVASGMPGAGEVYGASQLVISSGFRAIGQAIGSFYKDVASELVSFKVELEFKFDELLGAVNPGLGQAYANYQKLVAFKEKVVGWMDKISGWFSDTATLMSSGNSLGDQCNKAKALESLGNAVIDALPGF
jgi:RHS repeat-associated protein